MSDHTERIIVPDRDEHVGDPGDEHVHPTIPELKDIDLFGKPGEGKSFLLDLAVSRFDRETPPAEVVHVKVDNVDQLVSDTLKKKKETIVGRKDVKHYSLMEIRPFLKTLDARLTRSRYATTSIREYLSQIQPTSLAEQYLEFYDAHPFYKEVCAGAKHHHWWKGGLEDHVREMIGVGMDLMDLYTGDMVFTRSDVIIVAFLHDFDKIWLYQYLTDEERAKNPTKYKEKQVFTYTKGATDIMDGYSLKLLELARYGIVPSNEQWSAVLFHEGGYSAANFDFRGPTKTGDTVSHANLLAPFMHILDMYSAMLLGRSLI